MKRAMPRAGEIQTVAAELLEYLSAAPGMPGYPSAASEDAVTAAAAETGRRAEDSAGLRQMFAAADTAQEIAPAVWGAEPSAAAETLRQEFLQQTTETLGIPVPAELGAAAPEDGPVRSGIRFTGAPEMQQTMDDISEFFRRDSRRYDNGFAGGNGT